MEGIPCHAVRVTQQEGQPPKATTPTRVPWLVVLLAPTAPRCPRPTDWARAGVDGARARRRWLATRYEDAGLAALLPREVVLEAIWHIRVKRPVRDCDWQRNVADYPQCCMAEAALAGALVLMPPGVAREDRTASEAACSGTCDRRCLAQPAAHRPGWGTGGSAASSLTLGRWLRRTWTT